MENDKSAYPGVVEAVSRFAGAFVGTLVVGGREIANCFTDTAKPLPKSEVEPSTGVPEKSMKSYSEKPDRGTLKKKTTPKRAKVKKKVENPDGSTRGQNRHPEPKIAAETKVIVETPETPGPTAEPGQSSGNSPDRKSVETD